MFWLQWRRFSFNLLTQGRCSGKGGGRDLSTHGGSVRPTAAAWLKWIHRLGGPSWGRRRYSCRKDRHVCLQPYGHTSTLETGDPLRFPFPGPRLPCAQVLVSLWPRISILERDMCQLSRGTENSEAILSFSCLYL